MSMSEEVVKTSENVNMLHLLSCYLKPLHFSYIYIYNIYIYTYIHIYTYIYIYI